MLEGVRSTQNKLHLFDMGPPAPTPKLAHPFINSGNSLRNA